MELHDLRPDEGAVRPRKRVARGNAGSGGTYAGRGRKGQAARSGGVKAPYFEGGQLPFVRRLPFKRGFKNIFRVHYTPVSLGDLAAAFDSGEAVTPQALVEVGLLRRADEPYKVLADGAIEKPLAVSAPRFSATARAAIEAAGGTCDPFAGETRRPGMGRAHRR
jgi:large subunit ribosomal protein L15